MHIRRIPNSIFSSMDTSSIERSSIGNYILKEIAHTSPRGYLTDFQLDQLLFEIQQTFGTAPLYQKSSPNQLLPVDQAVFIILSSFATRTKAINILNSWLALTKHFYFFTDQTDLTIRNFITLPELAHIPGRGPGQHRQLRGMKWLRKEILGGRFPEQSWFVLTDDDTWVNVPALLQFLQPYNPDLPIAFGFVLDNLWTSNVALLSGGATIALSRAAFHNLSDFLYTSTVPFADMNDVTLGAGFRALSILQVHSGKFYLEPVRTVGEFLYPPTYVGRVSFHHMNNPKLFIRMTCDSALYWKVQLPKCCENFTIIQSGSYLKVKDAGGF